MLPTSIVDRFWTNVSKTETCWLWSGAKKEPRRSQPIGYGRIVLSYEPLRQAYAHRISWEIHHGPIPKGKQVLHDCDNPPCVNPNHLFLGTQLDNMKDCATKQRTAYGVRNGRTLLSEQQVQEIRERLTRGESTRSVAKLYGRGKSTIWSISAGINWSHLNG